MSDCRVEIRFVKLQGRRPMEFDPRASELVRRRFLQFGGVGALTLGGLLRTQTSFSAAPSTTGIAPPPTNLRPIRACIFIFYYGGPSHLDTYDLKPEAPSNIRGEFKPIATTIPGLQVSEHLPNMAKVMHHCALIRSMHHANRLHDSASIETHTGRQAAQGDREEFAPIEQFFPCHGAVVHYFKRDPQRVVSHAALPFVFRNVIDVPCQGGGFLGSAFDPFRATVDPEKQSYAVQELLLRGDLPTQRLRSRTDLLAQLQSANATPPQGRADLRPYYDKAFQLLSSESIRKALDLSEESTETREMYGVYPAVQQGPSGGAEHGYARHMRGQNLLVARRLVEAGVPFVNVYDFRQQGQNWDSHSQNFAQHRDHLLPPADKALAALLVDLERRGLLESTLVVAAGEFGRTPQINANAGRDHWPDCYTVLLAGGGVQGGAIYGASNAIGAYPAKDPVTPAHLAATIYWRFGLHPAQHMHDRTERPWRLADADPLSSLFAS